VNLFLYFCLPLERFIEAGLCSLKDSHIVLFALSVEEKSKSSILHFSDPIIFIPMPIAE